MYNIKETNFMTVDVYVKLVIINKVYLVCNVKIKEGNDNNICIIIKINKGEKKCRSWVGK